MLSGYPGPMTDRRTFGQAIREARLSKGMSMGQLATAVERSTASVRRWERDQGVPTETVVQDLIVVLNLDEAEATALAAHFCLWQKCRRQAVLLYRASRYAAAHRFGSARRSKATLLTRA